MRKSLLATAIGASLVLAACSDGKPNNSQALAEKTPTTSAESMDTKDVSSANPLLQASPLQDQAPQFDKIKVGHFRPAFNSGFEQHRDQISAIADNAEPATFDNTIVAMEKSGELLSRVARVFFSLASLNSDDEIQEIQAEVAPQLSEHNDNIYLNPTLFARVDSIHQHKSELSAEDQRLVDFYYDQFVRAGAKLSEQDKAQVRTINTELAKLSTEFNNNILDSFKNDVILVADKEELDGLSEDQIASLAAAAEGAGKEGYMISLVNTTRNPILGSLKNRELRQKIWESSANRAADNNGPLLVRMAELRADKAKLLGYADWASYVTADQMAKTPQAVFKILDDLAPKAVAKAKAEAADIQAIIEQEGGDFSLQPWDWAFYAEKVRAAKYDLDESEVKPYFEFNRVLDDGLFFAMQHLYGITVKARSDLPVWNPDVKAYEIFNADGSSVGLFYLDPYAREGKSGGAWMDEYVTQSHLLGNKPVVYNALNIPKPAQGQPTLMTFDEVSTMFHEFGHAVHGLFSQVKYPSLAGTATARDFVEFPSQFHEDWSIEAAVIANYAKHYETGEAIPQALLDKILKAHKFNQGFDTTEYLASALLDMEWHSIPAGTKIEDFNAFEKQALAKHGIDYAPVPPRYKSAYFSHIFAGGYSSGYYAYLWTEVFAADAFAYLQEKGGLNRKNGDSYRKHILSMGNSQDLMEDYLQFRGQEPSVDALLVRRGLLTK
ncbi:peptidyl-dipeptidase Dcp . Metallo peptidase. MEROPS family M03A [Microbulbifer donghaiensis]|uniref:Peptidyl-dipeptidase Dcp. Metallo peptidase. MEROPS family M03A n=1 Tax=Microbulbifer donghaiensis TaxID=494016 RepID=A0A1M4VQI0_9GAMM|nr:M3 family metallopeptidase [Microbulbifer donghaiensis]SHE71286.1 peptidyl-dipeptidase Dcp . Metallo peptidase. MEROPS family M03A [Microbulbifer donghaiensis]